jgi:hypothetical protein
MTLLSRGNYAPLNARIDYGTPGDPNFRITGYRNAATLLVKHVVETESEQDTLIFPIVFLWRNAIELLLKEIVYSGAIIADKPRPKLNKHPFATVWPDAKKYILQHAPKGPKPPEVAIIEKRLKEFDRVDAGSYAFRYPVANNGAPSLPHPTAPDAIAVDRFHEEMEQTADFLEAVMCELNERRDYVVASRRT